jgi:hypothetical protein
MGVAMGMAEKHGKIVVWEIKSIKNGLARPRGNYSHCALSVVARDVDAHTAFEEVAWNCLLEDWGGRGFG